METNTLFSNYEDDEFIDLSNNSNKYHSYEEIIMHYDTLKLNNITKNVMTRYEKAKVLGVRSQQLAKGAIPLIDIDNLNNVEDIAVKELLERKTPYILKRKVANKFEYWKIEDLIIT